MLCHIPFEVTQIRLLRAAEKWQKWLLPLDSGRPSRAVLGQLLCRKLRSVQKVKHSQVQAACVPTCIRSGAACGRLDATCQVFTRSLRHAWRHDFSIHALSRVAHHSAHGHQIPAVSTNEDMRTSNVHEPVVMVVFLYKRVYLLPRCRKTFVSQPQPLQHAGSQGDPSFVVGGHRWTSPAP